MISDNSDFKVAENLIQELFKLQIIYICGFPFNKYFVSNHGYKKMIINISFLLEVQVPLNNRKKEIYARVIPNNFSISHPSSFPNICFVGIMHVASVTIAQSSGIETSSHKLIYL